jgi:hypothetical protein
MRDNFVIIVTPEFRSWNDEEDKENICNNLIDTIMKIRGIEDATIDWEGQKDELLITENKDKEGE